MSQPAQTTQADVEQAFRQWCALMGVPATETGQVGSFRLGRDEEGRVRVEQVAAEGGGIEVVAPGMAEREFCDAVRFLEASFRIKTLQVARAVARRRSKSRGSSLA
ncbi:MAG: hypothetical protein HY901_11650 [Deltaproteobacteria bacterium]|nr:hypothetical protein [Deltaproteobacteria bacterium]